MVAAVVHSAMPRVSRCTASPLDVEGEFDLLRRVLANADGAEALQVGHALEGEDPLDQAASFISSMESSRNFDASRPRPQLANILASMRWLMAVSSAVSTLFSG